MNADEILARTFAEHERQAPDPETVLADVHARLARRRRTIPLLAAAATVAAIAIGASVLVDQHRRDAAPPASTPAPTVAPQKVAVDTTWLPPGAVRTTGVLRYYGRQSRTYSVTGTDRVATTIDLQVSPGSDLTPTNGGEAPSELGFRRYDLTIGGRPAREWRNDTRHQDWSYTVVVRLPDDRVAQVAVSVSLTVEGRGAALAAIGRRIAASLRLDRPEPVETAYRPTYVPDGFVVQAVGRDDLNGTSWILGTPGAVPDGAAVTIHQDPNAFTAGTVPGTAVDGRAVQGRPTHVITDGATVTLWIDLLRPGASVQITATHAAVPLAELYKIADGIRF